MMAIVVALMPSGEASCHGHGCRRGADVDIGVGVGTRMPM